MKTHYFLVALLLCALCGNAQEYRLSDDGQSIAKPKDTLFKLSNFKDYKIRRIDRFFFDSERNRILFATETETDVFGYTSAEHYVFFISGNRIEPLSEFGRQQYPAFSPNGRMVAFVRGGNLFIKKFDYGTETAVTEDGDSIINGAPNWIYKKEFPAQRYFEWSPDGKMLAFVRFDDSAVGDYCIDMYPDFDPGLFNPAEFYPQQRCYKFPVAGSENPKISLNVYDVQYRSVQQLDVADDDIYLLRMDWLPGSGHLAVVLLNRPQSVLSLLFINPKANVARSILKENLSEPFNIDKVKDLRFLPDDQFYWTNQNDETLLYSGTGIVKQKAPKGIPPAAKMKIEKPRDFDDSKAYPLVFVFEAVDDSALVKVLAENGYLVAGQMKRSAVGTQLDAARQLCRQSYVDSARVYALGFGEGAETALLAMSRDSIFKAGIAIAPITDRRFDNSLRAERYWGRPQENFEAYLHNSPLEQAGTLRGKVLLLHGTADDDAHLQNTLVYAGRLSELGKPHEMQIYRNAGHDIPKEVLCRRVLEFLNKAERE